MMKPLKGWVKKEHNNTVKAIYNKPTDNFILNGEKLKDFPSEIQNKKRIAILIILIQYIVLKFLAITIKQEKIYKRH